MKGVIDIYTFLRKLDNQLFVPIFQRDYAWLVEQWGRLIEDILNIDLEFEKDKHFIGTIIHKPQPKQNPSDFGKDLLIDGQQRLTTIFLLLCAICAYCKNNNINFDWKNKIYNTVLTNMGDCSKIRLKDEDDKFIQELLETLPAQGQLHDPNKKVKRTNNTNKILACYNSFYSRLNEDNIETIFSSIQRLTIYDGEAEEHDDPQELFDSLNSTGMQLELYETIRNFVLMDFNEDEQTRLYYNYWKPIEDYFVYNGSVSASKFKAFLHADLYFLKGKGRFASLKSRDIYPELKRTLHMKKMSRKDYLEHLKYSFEIYKSIDVTKHTSVKNYYELKGIFSMGKLNKTLALLLFLYDLNNRGECSDESLYNCLKILNSYTIRGRITKKPNKTFEHCDLSKVNPNNLVNSWYNMVVKEKVSDDSFEQHIMISDFYKENDSATNSLCKYILETIEMSFHSKGNFDFNNYSVEHVMPQTLTKEWEQQLGPSYEEVHRLELNSLGNLTLVAYNSELSNETFQEKLEMEHGFKEDRLYLNKHISQNNYWNGDTITARTQYLAKLMVSIFSYPILDEEYDLNNQSILIEGK